MRMFAGVAVALLAASPAAAAGCRQALALGLDVSLSVDRREHRLQVRGLAAALVAPDVRAAFLAAPEAPVALAVYDWSGAGEQRLLIPWTDVTDSTILDRVAVALRAVDRPAVGGMTGVGSAMVFGARLLDERLDCRRLTLDLSGDGIGNSGHPPGPLAAASSGARVTVNGLAIGRPGTTIGLDPDLQGLIDWYRAEVIQGPGAFVEVAMGFEDFASAMRRKLLRELQLPLAGTVSDGDEG